jgi:N-acyl-D-aspartate/D-glutamate deacylase
MLPDWALKEDRAGLRAAAKDDLSRKRLHGDIYAKLRQNGWRDLSHVVISSGRPEWLGRTFAEIPVPALDVDSQIENLIEISIRGGAQAIYADMYGDDVDQIVRSQFAVFGSDSAVRDADAAYKPHPRGCGTFPRVFRVYVREKHLLDLSEAVRKASGAAAEIFGLEDRGVLQPGAWADVVVFDLARIEDRADYDKPFAEPSGIDYVIVNGVIAVDHGNLTETKPAPGKALRERKIARE